MNLKSLFGDKIFDKSCVHPQRILCYMVIPFVVFLSLALGGSAYAQTSTTSIITDYDSYYTDHGALLNVTYNASPNPQPPTISVNVKSNADGTVCPLTLYQSHNAQTPTTYVFSGSSSYDLPIYIMFTTTSSTNCSMPQLAVSNTAPTITITTSDGISKTITTTNSDSPSNWTVKTTDQPYKKVIIPCPIGDQISGGDGICDSWKDQQQHPGYLQIQYTDPLNNNITYKWGCNPTTNNALTQDECPTKGHKDIYVETDWFLRHHPDARMISALKSSFAAAPISNADGKNGINLHIILDEEIPYHKDQITTPSPGAPLTATSDFDILKTNYFGTAAERAGSLPSNCGGINTDQCVTDILTAKRQVFHYALVAHSQAGGYSGASELPGNDMMISLGGFTGGVGSLDQLEGTFMHELGHNLNLYHGGSVPPDPTNPDYDNCKPNYLSVMNYNFQFSDFIWNRSLNYSGGVYNSLDKNSLNENTGVYRTDHRQPATPPNTVYGIPNSPYFTITPAGSSWYTYGTDFDGRNDGLLSGVPGNVNNMFYKASCNVPNPSTNNLLNDFNDWSNLLYDMKTTSAFYDGAPITANEGIAVDTNGATTAEGDESHGISAGRLAHSPPAVPAHTGDDTMVKKYGPIPYVHKDDASRLSSAVSGNIDAISSLHSNPAGFVAEDGISLDNVRSIREHRILSLELNATSAIATFGVTSNSTYAGNAINDIQDAKNFVHKDSLYPALNSLHKARINLSYSLSNTNNAKNKTLALLDDVVKSLETALIPVKSYPSAPINHPLTCPHSLSCYPVVLQGSQLGVFVNPLPQFAATPHGQQLTTKTDLTHIQCDIGKNLIIHARGSAYVPSCITPSAATVLTTRAPTLWITSQQYVQKSSNLVTVQLNSPDITNRMVTLDGTATASTGSSIVNINWNWGDGQTGTGSFPQSHTYSKDGTYTITVTATDSKNLTGSASTLVVIYTPPSYTSKSQSNYITR